MLSPSADGFSYLTQIKKKKNPSYPPLAPLIVKKSKKCVKLVDPVVAL